MTLKEILNKFKFTAKVGFKTSFLDVSIEFNDVDRLAAWDMYIELVTRVSTQDLEENTGDEISALKSIYGIFQTTRDVLHKNGPRCLSFAKVAIVVLNKMIRPFTAKWHALSDKLTETVYKEEFRADLANMHTELKKYTEVLAHIAGLSEDISDF